MGWTEWPLILFTVLAQTAVGAYWLCSLAVLRNADGPDAGLKIERRMLAVWIFLIVGFGLSAFHLGSPFRAVNALFRLGHAPLSNESFFGPLTVACGLLAWFLAITNMGSSALRKLLLVVGMVSSLIFLASMISFYLMETVPTWNNWTTPVSFIATALLCGSALATIVLRSADALTARHETGRRALFALAAIACIGAMIATVSILAMLPGINSSITHAAQLSPDIGQLQAVRFLLLAVGAGLLALALRQWQTQTIPLAFASLVVVFIGEIIGRGVFFALHMTVGLV